VLENINGMPEYIGADFNIIGPGKIASMVYLKLVI